MSKKLKIITKKDGFRRAGFTFSTSSETIIDVADINKVQLKQLKEEPMLVVVEFEEKEKKQPKAKQTKKPEDNKTGEGNPNPDTGKGKSEDGGDKTKTKK